MKYYVLLPSVTQVGSKLDNVQWETILRSVSGVRAYAWLNDRDYVVPEDIQLIAPDVLRHRIILSFEAEAEGRTADSCIDQILRRVAIP